VKLALVVRCISERQECFERSCSLLSLLHLLVIIRNFGPSIHQSGRTIDLRNQQALCQNSHNIVRTGMLILASTLLPFDLDDKPLYYCLTDSKSVTSYNAAGSPSRNTSPNPLRPERLSLLFLSRTTHRAQQRSTQLIPRMFCLEALRSSAPR
jgi:hypothetical protein